MRVDSNWEVFEDECGEIVGNSGLLVITVVRVNIISYEGAIFQVSSDCLNSTSVRVDKGVVMAYINLAINNG